MKAGVRPNPRFSRAGAGELPPPVQWAIYYDRYETLQRLLKNGAEFNFWTKPWIIGDNGTHQFLKKPPNTPRVHSLVKLTLYKDEIKSEWRTLLSIILQWFGIVRPQDKEQKIKASEVLFDVMMEKRPPSDLDRLKSIEKSALEESGSRLGNIYQGLFAEIKQMKESEKNNSQSEKAKSSINLNAID